MKNTISVALTVMYSAAIFADSASVFREWRASSTNSASDVHSVMLDEVPALKLSNGSSLSRWQRGVDKCCATVTVCVSSSAMPTAATMYRDLIFDEDGRLREVRPAFCMLGPLHVDERLGEKSKSEIARRNAWRAARLNRPRRMTPQEFQEYRAAWRAKVDAVRTNSEIRAELINDRLKSRNKAGDATKKDTR